MNRSACASPAVLSVVLLAARDASTALQTAIQSILAQSLPGITLYVLDLNPQQSRYSLGIQEDLARFPAVQYLSFPGNATRGRRRNQALQHIRTPYVAFLDAADLWSPEKARQQWELLERDPDAAVCCCGYEIVNTDRREVLHTVLPPALDQPERWLVRQQDFSPSMFLYRTAALKRSGGFHKKMDQWLDLEFLLRTQLEGGRAVLLKLPLFQRAAGRVGGSPAQTYQSAKHLYHAVYDLFLQNKRLYFCYNLQLADFAAASHEWAFAVIHLVVAVSKSPLYVLYRTLLWVLRSIRRVFCSAADLLRLQCARRRLLRQFRLLHTGRCPGEHVRRGRRITALHQKRPSARHFRGQIRSIITPEQLQPLQYAFQRNLEQVTLRPGTVCIPYGTFAGCTNLQTVVLPASVQKIDACAFFGCKNLQNIRFASDSALAELGAYAFANCTALARTALPETLRSIGPYAFAGCTALEGLHFFAHHSPTAAGGPFPAALTTLPHGLFAGCRTLQQVQFPEDSALAHIGDDAFLGCRQLRRVQMPGPLQTIGAYAFAFCRRLENFVVPKLDSVQELGRACFRNCQSLNYFRIPYNVKRVPARCFYGCSTLRSVKTSRELQLIEHHAFAHCPQLDSIVLYRGVDHAANAFDPDIHILRQETEPGG